MTTASGKGARRYAYLTTGESADQRFPNALRVGGTVYLSSEPSISSPPSSSADIRDQTRRAFSDFVRLLEQVGVRMADLVKLHTFYVFDGDDGDATRFWERMTEVRLQFFADPGPAGTALRVKGAPIRERLIAIDGVASVAAQRQRLMPAHAWDWSMPTPLSQGWRIGDVIYAGGQISADRRGQAVAADDLDAQTRNTMEFLRHVLLEAGAGFADVVALKICYRHRGEGDDDADAVLAAILRIVRPLLPPGSCVLTCLGIDLLYEGLQLEIDAMAIAGSAASRRIVGGERGGSASEGFAAACAAGGRVFVGAISAPEAGTLESQLDACLDSLDATLRGAGTRGEDLVKLNALFVAADDAEVERTRTIESALRARLPSPGPVVTIVRVAGLPLPGQRVQLDGVAMTG